MFYINQAGEVLTRAAGMLFAEKWMWITWGTHLSLRSDQQVIQVLK